MYYLSFQEQESLTVDNNAMTGTFIVNKEDPETQVKRGS
jgi:hypothetical protein